jgi:hypothetical protein
MTYYNFESVGTIVIYLKWYLLQCINSEILTHYNFEGFWINEFDVTNNIWLTTTLKVSEQDPPRISAFAPVTAGRVLTNESVGPKRVKLSKSNRSQQTSEK